MQVSIGTLGALWLAARHVKVRTPKERRPSPSGNVGFAMADQYPTIVYKRYDAVWHWKGVPSDTREAERFLGDLRAGKFVPLGARRLRIAVPATERAIDSGGVLQEFLTVVADSLFVSDEKTLVVDETTREVTAPSIQSLCAQMSSSMSNEDRNALHVRMTLVGRFLAFVQNQNENPRRLVDTELDETLPVKLFTLPVVFPLAFFQALLDDQVHIRVYNSTAGFGDLVSNVEKMSPRPQTIAEFIKGAQYEDEDRVGYSLYPVMSDIESLAGIRRCQAEGVSHIREYAQAVMGTLWNPYENPAFAAIRQGYLAEVANRNRTPAQVFDLLVGSTQYSAQDIIDRFRSNYLLPGKLSAAIRLLSADERLAFVRFVTGTIALRPSEQLTIQIVPTWTTRRLQTRVCFDTLQISPDDTWRDAAEVLERLREAFASMQASALGNV